MLKRLFFLVFITLVSTAFAQTDLASAETPNHKITVEQAAEFEARYISKSIVTEEKPSQFSFDLEQVKELVNSINGKWFNVRKGMDEKNKENVILSILDAKGQVMGNYVLELSLGCPPRCP